VRAIVVDGVFHVGARDRWHSRVGAGQSVLFPVMAAEREGLAAKLAAAPGIALYGECIGCVSDFDYATRGHFGFRCFDAKGPDGRWLDFDELATLCDRLDVETVPVLYRGKWSA